MPEPTIYECRRIRAGPLVKECRMIRPRYCDGEPRDDRRQKRELKDMQHSALTWRQVDQLEIRLALLGFSATHYVLTFAPEHLPPNFKVLQKRWDAFMKRVRRHRRGVPLDYVYVIEGLHEGGRYHIHFICRSDDLSPEEVRFLWRYGMVNDTPVLKWETKKDLQTKRWYKYCKEGFRGLAYYLLKERLAGIIPVGKRKWNSSRTPGMKCPLVEVWEDTSPEITVPPDAVYKSLPAGRFNRFGSFYYADWIEFP